MRHRIAGGRPSGHVKALEPLLYSVGKVEKGRPKIGPTPLITSPSSCRMPPQVPLFGQADMGMPRSSTRESRSARKGGGLITYMRTDSTRLSQDAVQSARDFILQRWGNGYLPASPPCTKPGIRPGSARGYPAPPMSHHTPESLSKFLSREAVKLYTLIWKRSSPARCAPALFDQTTIDIFAKSRVRAFSAKASATPITSSA